MNKSDWLKNQSKINRLKADIWRLECQNGLDKAIKRRERAVKYLDEARVLVGWKELVKKFNITPSLTTKNK